MARFGFTLLELILVMAILATVMALAAPKLSAWGRGAKLRNSADDFVTATKFARTHAVSSGYPCVVSIDKQGGAFSVKQQNVDKLTPVDGEFGDAIPVLEGGKIDAVGSGRTPIDAITFYPSGRVEPATVTITADDGESKTITCGAPSEDFAVVEQNQ